ARRSSAIPANATRRRSTDDGVTAGRDLNVDLAVARRVSPHRCQLVRANAYLAVPVSARGVSPPVEFPRVAARREAYGGDGGLQDCIGFLYSSAEQQGRPRCISARARAGWRGASIMASLTLTG